jgi:hypothetical protein
MLSSWSTEESVLSAWGYRAGLALGREESIVLIHQWMHLHHLEVRDVAPVIDEDEAVLVEDQGVPNRPDVVHHHRGPRGDDHRRPIVFLAPELQRRAGRIDARVKVVDHGVQLIDRRGIDNHRHSSSALAVRTSLPTCDRWSTWVG